ncbi:MAG: DUF6531 domain-containing protein [Corynebacterium sp.]|uniref:DUF6531 domain-containing protein n=1 Tax=Corynebacterium sp. TaxID=1720 RepID=UPI0026E068F3|nr:DUF6531 domain-containing protein [Corynebacterium sp.]MDO5669804.1 DUF6531 domain-containing protein [Corynebacterium sp.]
MPVMPLLPFAHYKASEFHVGGNPGEVGIASARWVAFGEQALTAAAAMRGINDGGFIGTEGDRYRELVHAQFPSHLDITGQAHSGVGEAIGRYQVALVEALGLMETLVLKAVIDHAEVQAAVAGYNTAEFNAARAAVTAQAATASAVATSLIPGVNAATAAAAATAQADAAAAQSAFVAAQARHSAAVAVWEGDIASSQGIKAELGAAVTAQVAVVQAQARKRFEENPEGLAALWQDIKDWVGEHAELLKIISDALQIIGSIMLFIPGLQVLGAIFIGVGVGLKGLLAACGEVSWGEFLFDLVTCGAVGGLAKLAKLGKLGPMAAKMSTRFSDTAIRVRAGAESLGEGAVKALAKGSKCVQGLEPVDMASGVIVDFVEDVRIDGVLPLVIDRNCNSGHQLGRALGPRWVSRMDVRLEVLPEEVLMVAPDGAVITFPATLHDGTEVVADGRPWRLSYSDGAYRVRDIRQGLTWVFAIAGTAAERRPSAPVADDSPALTGSRVGMGIRTGSLAEQMGEAIEIGISAEVHHTGAWIEYDYSQSTGHMVRLRRSDGTTLSLTWDERVSRVAGVWVSHTDAPSGDSPQRLISYEYGPAGELLRVINSAAGQLSYIYDEQGRLRTWTDRNGVSYHYRLDDAGRVVSQVGTGGMFPNAVVWLPDDGDDAPVAGTLCVAIEAVGQFRGDPLDLGDSVVEDYLERLEGLPLVQALRAGGLRAAGLTGRGRDGARSEDHHQVPEEWLFDSMLGQLRPTVYRATANGDVWRVITPRGAALDREYNQWHDIVCDLGPTGSWRRTHINDEGLVIREEYSDGSDIVIEPGAWGNPSRVIGRDGQESLFTVDAAGLVTSMTAPDGATRLFDVEWRSSGAVTTAVTEPDGSVVHIECDDAGRILAVTDAAGRRTSYTRNVHGLPVEVMEPDGSCTRIDYTPEGWPYQITHPDGTSATVVYDGEGNAVERVDELGRVTRTQFTVFDKARAVEDVAGGITTFEYNTQMELTCVTNADGRTWTYERNRDGEVIRETDFNGFISEFDIDPDGWWSVEQDAAGSATRYYDADGHLTRVETAFDTVHYRRDSLGRLLSVVNKSASVEFLLDSFGRRTGETVTLSSGESFTTREGVDSSVGSSTQAMVFPDDTEYLETYTRDGSGGIVGQRVHVDGREVLDVRLGVDSRQHRNTWSTGNVARHFEHDQRGRVVSDTLCTRTPRAAGTEDLVSRLYGWRADNVLEQIDDRLRGTRHLEHDNLGRITANQMHGFGDTPEADSALEEFRYSAAGVRVKAGENTEFGGTMPVRVGRTSVSYDDAGRVTTTRTRRVSRPPLVQKFYYEATGQPVGFRVFG